jgi:hypothetical protein
MEIKKIHKKYLREIFWKEVVWKTEEMRGLMIMNVTEINFENRR